MEMRLIDADATIKYLREFKCKDCDRRKGMKMRFIYEIGDAPCRACDIGDTIDYFLDEDISPTIDAVPVVRCKDCTHRNNSLYCPIALLAETVMKTKVFDFKVSDDWFCADGEKK